MNCIKCGATDLPVGAGFCTYCGAATAAAGPAPAQSSTNPVIEMITKAQGQGLKVDDRLIWVLALMPLLGEIIEGFVAGMFYGNGLRAAIAVHGGQFWWVTMAINIFLCWKDEKNLAAAGVDTSQFGKMLWLVPVYLYKRAKALGHSLAYFITWCVCFAILLY